MSEMNAIDNTKPWLKANLDDATKSISEYPQWMKDNMNDCLPTKIVRIHDGMIFSLNDDGRTYSLEESKKDFPDALHNRYTYELLMSLDDFEVYPPKSLTYTVILKNFKSKKQAETFLQWYIAQGEQMADQWFDINEQETPMVDCHKKREHDKINKTITAFIQ